MKKSEREQIESELEKVTNVLTTASWENVFFFTEIINERINELKSNDNQDYELALMFQKKRDYLYDSLFKHQIPADYLKEYEVKEKATSRI